MKHIALLISVCLLPLAASAHAPDKVVKVFILAGQSNMEGHGNIRTIDDLANAPGGAALLKKLKNPDGSWAVRKDVFMYYQRAHDTIARPLTVGQGCSSDEIGPELMFGTDMGEYYKQPVLLIKTCWGGKDLYCDFRPPSAGKPPYRIGKKFGKERHVGLYYHKMVDEVRECLANMARNFPQLKGYKPEITGFVWFQGWNEMYAPKEVQQQVYAEYPSNYAHMIADLEKDLHVPSLPSVVGEMGANGPGKHQELHAAEEAILKQPSLKGKVVFVKTTQFWMPELDKLQGKMNQLAGVEMKKLSAEYKAAGRKDKNGKPLKPNWYHARDIASKGPEFQKLQAAFDKKGSHWVCHYWGSGRIYCQIGNALAHGMEQLVKPTM